MVCQYGVALESRENMPITVLSPCQLFIFLSREAHVTGQGKEQTSQAVTQHKPMCLERQEYSECYIFTRPVPACWWMHSIEAAFQEKDTGTGLEDQPASFSVLQAPEAGEHVPPYLFAEAFLGAGPQQSSQHSHA